MPLKFASKGWYETKLLVFNVAYVKACLGWDNNPGSWDKIIGNFIFTKPDTSCPFIPWPSQTANKE